MRAVIVALALAACAPPPSAALYPHPFPDARLVREDGSTEQDSSTEVTFEDGRKGKSSARVKSRDVQTFGLGAQKEAAE